MALRNEDGYILGLLTYCVRPDLHHRSVLTVENFVAMSLLDREAVVAALLGALRRQARELSCGAIHTAIAEEYTWLTDYCRESGHELEKLGFCARLDDGAEGRGGAGAAVGETNKEQGG